MKTIIISREDTNENEDKTNKTKNKTKETNNFIFIIKRKPSM